MNCFQAIEAITAPPVAGASGPLEYEQISLQHPNNKHGTFGQDGYALFVRENSKLNIAGLTRVGLYITIARGFHSSGFDDLYEHYYRLIFCSFVLSVVLYYPVLRLKKLELPGTITVDLWIGTPMLLFYYFYLDSLEALGLRVFLLYLICIILTHCSILAMYWPQLTWISWDWKEFRLPYFHENKGTKQS